jgi:hypothetical protein
MGDIFDNILLDNDNANLNTSHSSSAKSFNIKNLLVALGEVLWLMLSTMCIIAYIVLFLLGIVTIVLLPFAFACCFLAGVFIAINASMISLAATCGVLALISCMVGTCIVKQINTYVKRNKFISHYQKIIALEKSTDLEMNNPLHKQKTVLSCFKQMINNILQEKDCVIKLIKYRCLKQVWKKYSQQWDECLSKVVKHYTCTINDQEQLTSLQYLIDNMIRINSTTSLNTETQLNQLFSYPALFPYPPGKKQLEAIIENLNYNLETLEAIIANPDYIETLTELKNLDYIRPLRKLDF